MSSAWNIPPHNPRGRAKQRSIEKLSAEDHASHYPLGVHDTGVLGSINHTLCNSKAELSYSPFFVATRKLIIEWASSEYVKAECSGMALAMEVFVANRQGTSRQGKRKPSQLSMHLLLFCIRSGKYSWQLTSNRKRKSDFAVKRPN